MAWMEPLQLEGLSRNAEAISMGQLVEAVYLQAVATSEGLNAAA